MCSMGWSGQPGRSWVAWLGLPTVRKPPPLPYVRVQCGVFANALLLIFIAMLVTMREPCETA